MAVDSQSDESVVEGDSPSEKPDEGDVPSIDIVPVGDPVQPVQPVQSVGVVAGSHGVVASHVNDDPVDVDLASGVSPPLVSSCGCSYARSNQCKLVGVGGVKTNECHLLGCLRRQHHICCAPFHTNKPGSSSCSEHALNEKGEPVPVPVPVSVAIPKPSPGPVAEPVRVPVAIPKPCARPEPPDGLADSVRHWSDPAAQQLRVLIDSAEAATGTGILRNDVVNWLKANEKAIRDFLLLGRGVEDAKSYQENVCFLFSFFFSNYLFLYCILVFTPSFNFSRR